MQKKFILILFFTILCLSLINGCGRRLEDHEAILSADCPAQPDTTVQESTATEDTAVTAPPVVEIYAGGDAISIPPDQMTASVKLNEILRGAPVLYNRFEIDNTVFEWLISDAENTENDFLEDAVLLISSRETSTEHPLNKSQIIHVEAQAGGANWVSAENKFLFTDANFDGLPDLLICSGHHGAQGALSYYCFLQTSEGFHEAPSFTDIPNPAIDTENKRILGQWRNSASSHSWAEYTYEQNAYVLKRELREQVAAETEDGQTVWVWTVNDVEIGRSSQLSDEEIEDLLYNENSDWQIANDRWRTLYNNGLTVDYSIYAEP